MAKKFIKENVEEASSMGRTVATMVGTYGLIRVIDNMELTAEQIDSYLQMAESLLTNIVSLASLALIIVQQVFSVMQKRKKKKDHAEEVSYRDSEIEKLRNQVRNLTNEDFQQ